MILIEETWTIATLALSTANASLIFSGKSTAITARLGSLSVVDKSSAASCAVHHSNLLSIEGDNFVEFKYQTHDPTAPAFDGVGSDIELHSAAVKLNFICLPLQRLYRFFTKFALLKDVYDAATEVAVRRASEITRLRFAVNIQSPIIVFPVDGAYSDDVLILRLGKLSGTNRYKEETNCMAVSLHGLHLESVVRSTTGPSALSIIDDVGIDVQIEQQTSQDQNSSLPDMKVMTNYVLHNPLSRSNLVRLSLA